MKDETDLVQKLLQHDEDVPVPPEHEKQIRAGLAHLLGGPPPPAGGGGAGGGGGSPPPASPLGKWLATTAIVAGAAAGGGFLAGRATAPVAVTAAPSSTPVAPAQPTPSPTPCAQDTTPPPKPSASAPTKATATGPNAQDAFDKEQSLLERARSALVRHDAASAEQALDECEKQFPKSRHAEERDYLRIQVTREKGDLDNTRALAKSFLTKYPQSMLKARVEQLAQ